MKASPRIFSNATQFAVVTSSFGSMVETASPSENWVMAHFGVTRSLVMRLVSIGRLPVTNSTNNTPNE